VGIDRGDPAVADAEQDAVGWSFSGIAAEPGMFTPPRVCHGVTQSAMTSAKATAPALQSRDSANSVGECDTPVGLRTNNIAVGTTADRIPASCPAWVGSTGMSPR